MLDNKEIAVRLAAGLATKLQPADTSSVDAINKSLVEQSIQIYEMLLAKLEERSSKSTKSTGTRSTGIRSTSVDY